MSVRDYRNVSRCSVCPTRRRAAVVRVLAYYQSAAGFKVILRLCWHHAKPVLDLATGPGSARP